MNSELDGAYYIGVAHPWLIPSRGESLPRQRETDLSLSKSLLYCNRGGEHVWATTA